MTKRPTTQDCGNARAFRRFCEAYAEHRADEGRGAGGADELAALPWVREGPLAAQWKVRARTFERFVTAVVVPLELGRTSTRPLRILDAGAGNGWLCYRMALRGHRPVACDVRTDDVDGLGAAAGYGDLLPGPLPRVAASFEALPLAGESFDLVVFNASLHYALDLEPVLRESARVLASGGVVAVLDSPFYRRAGDGEAMVREKRARAAASFGARADALTSLPFVEYLTRDRLADASRDAGLVWHRYRVRYPLLYELRPLRAALRGARAPSRFDVWVGRRA